MSGDQSEHLPSTSNASVKSTPTTAAGAAVTAASSESDKPPSVSPTNQGTPAPTAAPGTVLKEVSSSVEQQSDAPKRWSSPSMSPSPVLEPEQVQQEEQLLPPPPPPPLPLIDDDDQSEFDQPYDGSARSGASTPDSYRDSGSVSRQRHHQHQPVRHHRPSGHASSVREQSADSQISSSVGSSGRHRARNDSPATSSGRPTTSSLRPQAASRHRSYSSSSLTQQAQFTFASPNRANHPPMSQQQPPQQQQQQQQQQSQRHSTGSRYHYPEPPFSPRDEHGFGQPEYEFQQSPSINQQIEEDIRMSETPQPHDMDDDMEHGSQFGRSENRHRHIYSEYPDDSELRASSGQLQQRQKPQERSTTAPAASDTPVGEVGPVTMSANSMVYYHSSYNSGRGAVWRFFKVIESRVSGNTDRAQCILCEKKMLGKSADMKRHVVHSCPQRDNIPPPLAPILEIVKSELENPKRRAKRSGHTPSANRQESGSGFGSGDRYGGGDSGPSKLQVSTSGLGISSFPQPHTAPYESPSDAHRAKYAKYSRQVPNHDVCVLLLRGY
ncbi:hypothetical protein GQ54DRAFT_112887 [Martensiomyces pterosporus]|nr:hypothetical protein GQ54DRAFT_112887 [Martensiomyces pterosporus]